MRVLCVAEKPSIAKSITQILSGGRWETREARHQYIRNYDFSYNLPPPLGRAGFADFTVTAVLGHLTGSDFGDDLRKWHSCDPFTLFDAPIHTKVAADKTTIEQNLQREARTADLLMIWTDCDREGEHIGSEVAAVCRRVKPGLLVKRARFSAIIAAQIHNACRLANNLDMRQADAVEARINLDLRIGAAFTRFQSLSLQAAVQGCDGLISYGPCQFPTLGFVVDQYNRVQAFIPETFWYIYIAIEREGEEDAEDHIVEFKWWRNHLFDQMVAIMLYERCCEEPLATVRKVETKPTSKWKPLPLTTVELQQSGARLLHMAPKRVLDLAEKLYQKGFLSYPRTETDQFDKDFDFDSLVQKQTFDNAWGTFAQSLVDGGFQRPRNGKKNDKAHPPIHPTNHAGNLDADERRVFELVTRRFLASCSKNAEGKTTTVEIVIADESFSTSGLVVTQRNYLDVYPYDKWSNSAVPDFQEGEQFMPSICELKEGSTSRPNLLTEADLVGLMDKNGIGTDATIAEHIAKIIEREYVIEKQEQRVKYLVPSLLGAGLVEGYNQIGFDRSLTKPHLRRETEHRMQLICDGIQRKTDVLEFSVEQYKEVYIKARREFQTVIASVQEYIHGAGAAQDALRAAARSTRGGRGDASGGGGRGGGRRGGGGGGRGGGGRGGGGRGGGGRGGGAGAGGARSNGGDDDDDDDGDDNDDYDGPTGGASARVKGRGRGTTARGRKKAESTRGRAVKRGGGVTTGAAQRQRKRPGDDDGSIQQNGGARCQCELDAVLRTVQKAGSANQGRQFYTCSKAQGEQCGFFEWADDSAGQAVSGPGRSVPPPPKRPRTAEASAPQIGSDGVYRCGCDLEGKLGTATKAGANQGRQFWACPNNPRAQCGFFAWADEMPGGLNGIRRGGGEGGGGGGTTGECFNCGESGHWSNACPNGDGGQRGGGKTNTSSYNAKNSAFGGGSGGAGATGECYKCHRPGHWANACPNEEADGEGSGGRRGAPKASAGAGECYKCHETGHWARDCPTDQGGETIGRYCVFDASKPAIGPRSVIDCQEATGIESCLQRVAAKCFKCMKKGHFANQCRQDVELNKKPEGDCFICKEPGHYAYECPAERWARGTETGKKRYRLSPDLRPTTKVQKICYNCNKRGHFVSKCPFEKVHDWDGSTKLIAKSSSSSDYGW